MLWQHAWLCKVHRVWSWQLHWALLGTVLESISGDFIGEMLCQAWSDSRVFRTISVIPPFILWTVREMSMVKGICPKPDFQCVTTGAIIHDGGRTAVNHLSSWLISEILHYWEAEGSRGDCYKTLAASLPKPESSNRMRQHLANRAAEVHRNKLLAQTIRKKAGYYCWRLLFWAISVLVKQKAAFLF